MDIAIHLPDDVAAHVRTVQPDMPRPVLESIALAWYQSGELNENGVGSAITVHVIRWGWAFSRHMMKGTPRLCPSRWHWSIPR